MIANTILILLLSLGVGALFPSPFISGKRYLGITAFLGICAITTTQFISMVLLGSGFVVAFWVVTVAAAFGLATFISSISANRNLIVFLHPLTALPLCATILALFYPELKFFPYGYDIFINWLSHSKQLWLVNDFHWEGILSAGTGYPPGWHLMAVFSSPLWGEYSDLRVIGLSFAWHVALLGLINDICSIWLRTFCKSLKPTQVTFISLLIVLLLLGAEASWRLLPTLAAPELPLFYTMTGICLLFALYLIEDTNPRNTSLMIALCLCGVNLIKSQGIAAIPTAAILVIFCRMEKFELGCFLRSIPHLLIICVPVILVVSSWHFIGPQSPKCVGDVHEILTLGSTKSGEVHNWRILMIDIIGVFGDYFVSYKLPVSILAVLGILLGLMFPSLRIVSFFVLLFFAVYMLAVFWIYYSCPLSFMAYLSSILRYLQLPMRVFHTAGLVALALVGVHFVIQRGYIKFSRQLMVLLISVCAAGASYQIYQVRQSFVRLQQPEFDPLTLKMVVDVPTEAEKILKIVKERELGFPRVAMIYSFWSSFPTLIARHAGYPATPAELNSLENLSRWEITPFRFLELEDEEPLEQTKFSADGLSQYDVIWILQDIPALRAELEKLPIPPECVSSPSRYFIIRAHDVSKGMECIDKQ